MTTYEVKVTEEQLKALWAKTDWNDPFEQYSNNDDEMWEFFYMTERCPEVLKEEFHSLACDNEGANEILNGMTPYRRGVLIGKYTEKHNAELHEAYNLYWWSNHDVSDYSEE